MERFWSPRPEVLAYVEGLIQPGWRVLEIGPGIHPVREGDALRQPGR